MMLRIAFTSIEQDGRAMRQMNVCDVAELRCPQGYRFRERLAEPVRPQIIRPHLPPPFAGQVASRSVSWWHAHIDRTVQASSHDLPAPSGDVSAGAQGPLN